MQQAKENDWKMYVIENIDEFKKLHLQRESKSKLDFCFGYQIIK